MGLQAIDSHTKGHFLGGLFGVLAFDMYLPGKPLVLLVVANALHLVIELVEQERCPNRSNIVLESGPNHLADIVAFGVGSLIGYRLAVHAAPSGGVYGVLRRKFGEPAQFALFAVQAKLAYEGFREVFRELYPNADNHLLKGAYTENCYWGD